MPRKMIVPETPDWNKLNQLLKANAAKPKLTDIERAVRENYDAICLARQNGYNTNDLCDWFREAGISGVYAKSLNSAIHKESIRRNERPATADSFSAIATRFDLKQPGVEDLATNQFYLMQGREFIRVIGIESILNGKIQYRIQGEPEGKTYSSKPEDIVKILCGPISPEAVSEILVDITQ